MGGPTKIKDSCCLLSNAFGNGFWMDFGVSLETILTPTWPSEAASKASVIKYANQEGSDAIYYPSPIEIFSFGPQCERETGRASQADVTPYGVGG